jgi:hypothetical protein
MDAPTHAETALFGARPGDRVEHVGVALAVGAGTFGVYALDLVSVQGGVVFLPGVASLVGLATAIVVGARNGGFVLAWLASFTPLFGFNADWGLFGLSGHSLSGKLAFLVAPETMLVFGFAASVIGGFGFAVGWTAQYGINRLAPLLLDAES